MCSYTTCTLSLMTFFADINVSQDSVATYAKCGGIFDICWTANSPSNLLVKKILKSVKNWRNYGHESVAPFLAQLVEYEETISLHLFTFALIFKYWLAKIQVIILYMSLNNNLSKGIRYRYAVINRQLVVYFGWNITMTWTTEECNVI